MRLIEGLIGIALVTFLIYLVTKKPDDPPGPVSLAMWTFVYLPLGFVAVCLIVAAVRWLAGKPLQ
jgi:hypothetical protein